MQIIFEFIKICTFCFKISVVIQNGLLLFVKGMKSCFSNYFSVGNGNENY